MPRAANSVTDTELAILQVLWDRESATVREIVEEIYEEHTHSLHASVKSLLERLAEKGYVTCWRQGLAHVFSSVVGREAFVSQQLQLIADTNFGGSLTPLLLTLIDNVKLSREDRGAIRRMIEKIKESCGEVERLMLDSLVWNLLLTGTLAVVLAAASRISFLSQRPALRHALWLLLLAKLIAPPMIPVPLLPPAVQATPFVDSKTMASLRGVAEEPRSAILETNFSNGSRPAAVDAAANEHWRSSYHHVLLASSLIGTFLLVATYTVRAAKMDRWLRRFGDSDPTLDRTCREVAARLGIRESVRSCVVDALSVPLLWGWRRPMVVVPRQLVDHLKEEPLRCIVAHELAHYARRDQWSNLFVLWIKAVFWWYPVTWWAHREIRAAQESCCDALAIDCANTTRQNYATTLLKALDFVQPESSGHWTLAVQMGSRSSILRRFEMIGNTRLTYRVSRWTFLTLCVFMIPLSCLPVRSQEKQSRVDVVIDRSLSIDETSTNQLESQDDATTKEVLVAGNPERLVLVGIVWQRNPTDTEVTPTAWVSDRTTKKRLTLEKESTIRVGSTSSTVESMLRDAVMIRADNKLFRWKLGMNFREMLASKPAEVTSKGEGEAGESVKGELAGGGLSGPVQIELLDDTEVMILRGKKEDVKRLAKLIAAIEQSRLETPAEKPPAEKQERTEAYRVAPLESQLVLDVLQTLLAGQPNVHMAIDANTGNLIVSSSAEVHETIHELLDLIRLEEMGSRPARLGSDDKRVRFAFRYQPWSDVMKWFAETAGLSLVTDTAIPGTFNYQDNRVYTVAEAIDLLNGALLTKNFVLITRDRMLHVVNLADGIPADLIPKVKVEDLPKRGKFEFVSALLPIGDWNAEQIREEVQPLLGRHGRVTAMPRLEKILVADRARVILAVNELLASKRD